MVTRVIVEWTDDLDARKGKKTKGAVEVVFSYQGRGYKIDLATKNREAFERALAPYIEVAEELTDPDGFAFPVPSTRPDRDLTPDERRVIRAWWYRNWVAGELPGPQQRGSIPNLVVDAYYEHRGLPIPLPSRRPK